MIASATYRQRRRAMLRARGLKGVEARRRLMLERPAPSYAADVPKVSWRVSVQHYGSGEMVHLDLVPAAAVGLGRLNQWAVVVNESVLFSPAMGLDRFWRLCRKAMVVKL